MRNRVASVLVTLILVMGAVVMLFPFLWTVVTSVTSGAGLSATPSLIPTDPSLSAYQTLFSASNFGRAVANSIIVACAVTGIQLLTSSMAGYAFSRLDFAGKPVIFAVYLATMMIPMQVLLVPLFAQMKALGLVNSLLGVIVPSMASAFGVFLMRQAMATLPRELDEAATIDGAGHIRIFARVILPNVKPALVTFGIFAFMNSWNAFLWPLVILRADNLKTLPLALASLQGQFTTQWDVMMAGSVISILPMLAIYLFAQKYVIQGVAGSGLK